MPKPLLSSDKPVSKKPSTGIDEVEQYLDLLLAAKANDAKRIDVRFEDLTVQVGKLLHRGGKRVRPQLVINTYEAFGGTNREAIIKVAASQELFHAFALMHDDIIDRDVLRWGGPNITGHYLKEFSQRLSPQDARHHADAWALLAGDLCINLSFESLASSGFPPGRTLKAMQMAQQTLFDMVGGEVMDVAGSIYNLSDDELDESHFMRLYEAKTSTYSFCTPLRLGALFAGASAAYDKRLNRFGYHLGIAFQLRDDILGVFGDETRMGKSTLSDIREGRRTMLVSYGLKMTNPGQRQALQAILGNENASYADLKTVQTMLKSSGALSKTEASMRQHCDQARNILLRSSFPMALNTYLADLLAYSARRAN